jgi:hypothetical protein
MLIEANKRRLSSGSPAFAPAGKDRVDAETKGVWSRFNSAEAVRNRGALRAIQNVLS